MSGSSRQRPQDPGFDYGAFNTPAAPPPTTHPGKDRNIIQYFLRKNKVKIYSSFYSNDRRLQIEATLKLKKK